eukprot:scaffold29424_cov54-Cyclotella_meneghiniana.AAC.4
MTVEELMYKYKSDKSRDDHGYTKLYHMIFGPIRHSVLNITEVGIAAGQSIQAWYRYFPNAEIHAFDISWNVTVEENLSFLKDRVKTHIQCCIGSAGHSTLGFLPESMDVVIEDGPHNSDSQQAFLLKLFPLVKPGGYYIIEDIGYAQGGMEAFHENPKILAHEVQEIMKSHDTIWVDTSAGHRGWGMWKYLVGGRWVQDRVKHNSYCLVIQKRDRPLPPMQINYKNGAMAPDSIVKETGEI